MKARILTCKEKNVSFKDWVNKNGPVKESSSVSSNRTTAIVVYRKGNDQGFAQVENYIKDLGVETEEVFLLPGPKKNFYAEYILMRCTWSGIAKYLRTLGLQDVKKDDSGPHLIAILTGKASDVEKARSWLKEKVRGLRTTRDFSVCLLLGKSWWISMVFLVKRFDTKRFDA